MRLARTVLEGKYNWGEEKEITEHIKTCLLCKACVTNCPSSVATDEIVMEARKEINYAAGLNLFHKLVYRGLLSDQKRLKAAGSLARFYDNSGTRWLVKNSGLLNSVKKLKHMENILPMGLKSTLRSRLPRIMIEVKKPKLRVGYFAGCATNTFFGDIGEAAVLYLQKHGCEVEVPPIQCCGGPHQSAGDFEEAQRLARENIHTFLEKDYDFIISDCATCTGTLKEYEKIFANDENMQHKAKQFSDLVMDLNAFVVKNELIGKSAGDINKKVTYHDPCHAIRGMGVKDEPREILSGISGLDFVEMKEADVCCGGAGSYCFVHQEVSSGILEAKIENFIQTGADILATSCPACTMQLYSGLRKSGVAAQIKHPIQLLAESEGLL